MSNKSISQLFKKKADEYASHFGVLLEDVHFDAPKNRYVQQFEHGVILGYMKKLTMDECMSMGLYWADSVGTIHPLFWSVLTGETNCLRTRTKVNCPWGSYGCWKENY